MKKLILIILLLLAAASSYLVWRNLLTHSANQINHGNQTKPDSGIAYYHCGMHPWVTSDKPGKCSICGMTLTPVYKGDSTNEKGIVTIDPAMVQTIGVASNCDCDF